MLIVVWSSFASRLALPDRCPVNLAKIMQKRLTVTGSTMRPRPPAEKGAIARELNAKVWPLLEAGSVKIVVDRVFPLAEAAEAHRYLESSAHIGKVILHVSLSRTRRSVRASWRVSVRTTRGPWK
jgi:NADPH:quinone reductase-like Zn-dependent oxidoreductase